jgi:D-alanyl-D-alanine carboxypeptidase
MCTSRATAGLQYLALRGDDLLLEHCAGVADVATGQQVTPTTTFNAYSITKPFTAAAVLALAEAGRLDLDRPIGTAAGVDSLEARGSVRETLLHRAGFPNPYPLRWFHDHELHASFDEPGFVRERLEQRQPARRRSGARAAYSNIGYLALGRAIERVSGLTYTGFVEQAVLAPLALRPVEALGFAIADPARHARGHLRRLSILNLLLGLLVERRQIVDGSRGGWVRLRLHHVHGSAYGGLMANARGLAAFGQAVLGQRAGLSAGVRDQLLRVAPGPGPRRSLAWFAGSLASQAWLAHAGGGIGYYGELRLYPALGAVSVLLLNRPGLRDAQLLDGIDRPWIDACAGR